VSGGTVARIAALPDQPTNQPTNRATDRLTEKPTHELTDEDLLRLRVGRGPLPDAGGEPVADMAGGAGGVVRLAARRRAYPWIAAAAVAAAAAVVAVGASALQGAMRPSPAAVIVGDTSTVGPTATSLTPPPAVATPHLQLSTTDYTEKTFAAQARALLDDPATALPDLAAESPFLGPIATPVGLASCLGALGVGASAGTSAVTADLATFEGRPAAIIVVTDAGTSTAYAVERSCSPGNVTALAGPTAVP
jgi:hypothetical protein